MCKKIIAASLLSAFLLVTLPMSQAWAANTVQVTLPGFTVTLNGQSTGNEYSKYPLIVYKDITYFPMTYYDCRLLGLKTDWTEETGLFSILESWCLWQLTSYMKKGSQCSCL